MWYLFAGIIAAGPSFSPGHQGPTDPNHVTYSWSHNWAAVVGIVICLALLHVWFNEFVKRHEENDDDSDDSAQF